MTDERERRFRARIDLSTGRADVTETHPVDRRTAATIPSQVRAPERSEPPRTVEPVTAPLFPWQRSMPTPPPQEMVQPTWQSPELNPNESEPMGSELQSTAVVPDSPLGWVDPSPEQRMPWAGFDPALEQQAPYPTDARSELEQQEDRLVERLADRVMERLRVIYRLPPDEPPVLGAEHNPMLDAVLHAYSEEHRYHPAGAFASTPRPRVFHPAGAFANPDTP